MSAIFIIDDFSMLINSPYGHLSKVSLLNLLCNIDKYCVLPLCYVVLSLQPLNFGLFKFQYVIIDQEALFADILYLSIFISKNYDMSLLFC